MRDIILEFDINAGKVWRALNSWGSRTESQLMEDTRLSAKEVHAAIGWLARENKIYKDGKLFKLGETNLTVEFGEKAGKIWHVLHIQGESDILHISKLAQMNERDTYSALGWLAREGKINTKTSGRNDEVRSAKLEMENMKWELESLQADLKTRNHIIKEMTTQLTEGQTQFVENMGAVERLQVELEKNQDKMVEMKKELNKKTNDLSRLQNELGTDFLNPEFSTSTLFSKDIPLTQLQKQQNVSELGEDLHGKENFSWKDKPRRNCSEMDIAHDVANNLKTKTLDDDESEN
jgi:hypothetical protein